MFLTYKAVIGRFEYEPCKKYSLYVNTDMNYNKRIERGSSTSVRLCSHIERLFTYLTYNLQETIDTEHSKRRCTKTPYCPTTFNKKGWRIFHVCPQNM